LSRPRAPSADNPGDRAAAISSQGSHIIPRRAGVSGQPVRYLLTTIAAFCESNEQFAAEAPQR
jgi:hypothetical protein